jgi:hypothetical protein
MKIARPTTALLRTSAATDVKRSGSSVAITGLEGVFSKDIIKISQIKNRAEVVKVETIGGSSYTPVASTSYRVEISDPMGRREGYSSSIPKIYSYTTPATLTDIGATAALQREYIHGQLVTLINNDASNNVVAASLGTGTGFTVTDDAGYFPVKTAAGQLSRGGATLIKLAKDKNNRGFSDSADRTITTEAVYSFGQGARMLAQAPVVYALGGGNIIAGEIDGALTVDGLPAVSGQKYEAFLIESLVRSEIPTIGEVKGYRVQSQIVFVDNGKGSSTANATGYAAFEREMHKLMFLEVYGSDPKSVIEFFDQNIIFQGAAGAVPTTTGTNKMLTATSSLVYNQIGTQTITVPTPAAAGLNLDQDATDTEGAAYTPELLPTNGSKKFVVGKDEFAVIAKVSSIDWTDVYLKVGVRIKSAHTADFNDYTDLAAVGTDSNGDDFYTHGILNNAATVSTDTGVNGTDGSVHEFRIHVAQNGLVSAYIDDVKYPIYSAGTTALILDAGDEIVPFFEATNIGGGDSDTIISEFVAVADAYWKIDK